MSESMAAGMREPGQRPEPSGYDVVVLGAGPAGLVLARELAAAGALVLVVSPRVRRALMATYGLWLDEAEAAGIVDCVEATWPTATVRISDERAHVLPRPYARLDPKKLLDKLHAQTLARGARFLEDAADELHHDDDATTVRLEDGGEVRAKLVVDATGHSARFVARERVSHPAVQMAYGVFLEDAWLPEPETATIMDLRSFYPGEDESQPSFLYALRRPDGHALVEETSLVATPPVPERELARRLRARLERLGVRGREAGEEISCIPLGRPIPDEDQRVLGFGAAGGLVHPATGYMLAGALLRAAPLAQALADAIHGDVRGIALARVGWDALWPEDARETRELQVFGMEVLRLLDGDGLRAFFDAYFTAAGDRWPALMSFEARADEVSAVMERVFKDFPFSLKVRTSLLLTRRYRSLVPRLARALLGGAPSHGAQPPAHG